MSLSHLQYRSLLWFGISVLAGLLLLQISDRYPLRFDLTEEGRFSIARPTQEILGGLEQPVYVEVYLAGEMPGNFRRFQQSINTLLDEFRVYASASLEVEFIDPSLAKSERSRNEFYQQLVNIGLQPTNLNYTSNGETSQKMVFPGAVVSYAGQEIGINLLKGNRAQGPEEIINQSIEGLEYQFINAIVQLQSSGRKKVGYVVGHGEPDSLQLAAFTNLILSKYDLFKINLPARKSALTGYDLIIIGKPTKAFSEVEKYHLDQFVMKGGRLLFLLDALRVNMDSAAGEGTVAVPYQTDLEDLLFKYGVRINQDYVVDLNCGDFPVVAGNIGNQPQIRMLPWPYFPIITNYGKHPIVKNTDAVMVRFASTIDTVKAVGITKTPLMLTSGRSKVMGSPIQVSFNDLQTDLLPEKFQQGPQSVGYLLEGPFQSLFKNRFPPRGFSRDAVLENGKVSKIVVISDGDLIRNDLDLQSGSPLALGVEPYTQNTYGNEDLLMNIIDYLLDDIGVVDSRKKEIKIRPLDKVKAKEERSFWQVLNIATPLAVLLLFGLVKGYWRKRKNTFNT